ncbi:hypothetical protein DESUT3_28050 [Desulfuromonas versatilis]|uniref:DUF3108 domain-containing protein n=1 Tax=Desulfuromonas versatilis TaxID=2802975 RepID=A0ABM8HYY3_9BACT|nr:DUF3108 domain-containing protein [Desulfuromonas versatilis]BCR05736.1 hypothetical protein DESUT3_28050 [Desulfuromonas versatilis]
MKYSLLLLLLLLATGKGMAAEAQPQANLSSGPAPLEALVGEVLTYDISFLWFDRLAEGELSLRPGERPGTFVATLEARTLGVAAWLTRDRLQRYVSHMEIGPEGRLRSLQHESLIIKGKGAEKSNRGKLYRFDYPGHRVVFQKIREGEVYGEQSLPMQAENPPNDILTAFFNFRAGFFGPVQSGQRFVIPAFSRKGEGEIVVEILTDRQRSKLDFFPKGGVLARVDVDEEVFDTGGGSVYVWFDNFGRPARGIVENIIGLGDVKGTLRDRN